MADVYEQRKLFAEVFTARSQALKLRKDPTAATLDEAYKRFGYNGYLRRKVAILEQTPPAQIDAPDLAHQYALLDDEAHAMTWLERAYDERKGEVLFLRTSPELDSIRFSPPLPRLGPSHRVPAAVERQELNPLQTLIARSAV